MESDKFQWFLCRRRITFETVVLHYKSVSFYCFKFRKFLPYIMSSLICTMSRNINSLFKTKTGAWLFHLHKPIEPSDVFPCTQYSSKYDENIGILTSGSCLLILKRIFEFAIIYRFLVSSNGKGWIYIISLARLFDYFEYIIHSVLL